MDYEQYMPGRAAFDPSRAGAKLHRERGIGSVTLLVGAVVVLLALAIWVAGGTTDQSDLSAVPPVADSAAAAATD